MVLTGAAATGCRVAMAVVLLAVQGLPGAQEPVALVALLAGLAPSVRG